MAGANQQIAMARAETVREELTMATRRQGQQVLRSPVKWGESGD